MVEDDYYVYNVEDNNINNDVGNHDDDEVVDVDNYNDFEFLIMLMLNVDNPDDDYVEAVNDNDADDDDANHDNDDFDVVNYDVGDVGMEEHVGERTDVLVLQGGEEDGANNVRNTIYYHCNKRFRIE